ncbi:MAG: cbb3-type cytochrome oxidase assembly protein CcoS [Halioglobus sp.]|nr:cbb3-type cytochrome oxidase assembly protein CcoS [Halioglobus sp.]MBP6723623.1 cbb3-type cytochrome oxidase assembly protein CcoS [Halioglobus sp.]
MDSLYLLIPIALLFCGIAIKLLLWAIDSGQYDDLDKEAWKILADDEPPAPTPGPAAAEKSPGPEQTQ